MGVGVGMLVFAGFVEVEREERDWVGGAVTAAELVLAGRRVEGEVVVVAAVGGGGPEMVVVEHLIIILKTHKEYIFFKRKRNNKNINP